LKQDVAAAQRAYDVASAEATRARNSGINGSAYTPYKQAVEAAKQQRKVAKAALELFNTSHPP
jgi:hypothetical protein